MADLKQLLIQPAPGFTPHIGVLVSTMQMCRETTIRWCQDLTIQQLDYLWDENANTIGALLLDNQGYGYIDEQTPELSIAIAPTHRGHGIGYALLAQLLATAQERYPAVSLNVWTENPAFWLYQRLGFEVVTADGPAVTMVKRFGPSDHPLNREAILSAIHNRIAID